MGRAGGPVVGAGDCGFMVIDDEHAKTKFISYSVLVICNSIFYVSSEHPPYIIVIIAL